MEGVETREVHIAPIHHVERTGFRQDFVKKTDVRPFSIGNLNESGNGAAQIQQRMHLHRGLGELESGPRKQGQAQINGGRVESIDSAVEIKSQRLIGVHRPCGCDQNLGEVSIDAPVDGLVGVRERRARDATAEAHVIELRMDRTQAGFDVAQAFAIGQLREAQTKKLIPTGKAAFSKISVITSDAFLKLVGGKMFHHLSEHRPANMHALLSDLRTVNPPAPSYLLKKVEIE